MKLKWHQIFAYLLLVIIMTACDGNSFPIEVPVQISQPSTTNTEPQNSACKVPNLIGLDQASAESIIRAIGLQPVVSVEINDSVANGSVISQSPTADTRLEPCQGDVEIIASVNSNNSSSQQESPTSSPSYLSGKISFEDPNSPNNLNPVFGWQPGGSSASMYDFQANPGTLTLVTGPGTDQWDNKNNLPVIVYPFGGDFDATVTMVFEPNGVAYKIAGLGVRSVQDHRNWIRINSTGGSIAVHRGWGMGLNGTDYSESLVYLKIQRRRSLFTFSYSTNGTNWVVLQKDYVLEMPDYIEIYIFVYSTSHEGALAQFSDFTVESK